MQWRPPGINGRAKAAPELLPRPIFLAFISLTPTLMEQLAIRLSPQAGKSLVTPEGEGANESLREFHVRFVISCAPS